jgi:hypothetical protein
MMDMKQEGGCAGRCPEGLIVEDFYCVMISLKGFLHLFLRILNPNKAVHDSSHRKQQLDNLLLTLQQFLVLPPAASVSFFNENSQVPFGPALLLLILVVTAAPFAMALMIKHFFTFPALALCPSSLDSLLLAPVPFLTFIALRL